MAAFAVPKPFLLSSQSDEPLNADTGKRSPDDQAEQPAFITSQTLATFSGASAGAALLWKGLAALAGSWADERWVPFAISGVIGVWLILRAFENAKTPSDYFGAIVIGVVNTVQIWAAVIGLDVVLEPTVGVEQTGGATT